MTIEERARELWGKLPIIQEDYIPVIQAALEEQKAIDDSEKMKLIEKVIWLIEDSYPDTNFWGHSELVKGISADLKIRADELSDMFD